MRALRVIRERREAVAARVCDEVAGALQRDGSPAGQAGAAGIAHAAMDAQGRRVRSPVVTPACAAGCASCCHVHVDASGPEILAVARYLEGALPGEALEALRARLARHVARVEGLSDDARWAARIPCALLDAGGSCSVHPARPLRCRAFHSGDAGVCRDAFAGRTDALPPAIPALDRACAAVEEGYDRALAAAGIPAAPERLEAGLLRALARPR